MLNFQRNTEKNTNQKIWPHDSATRFSFHSSISLQIRHVWYNLSWSRKNEFSLFSRLTWSRNTSTSLIGSSSLFSSFLSFAFKSSLFDGSLLFSSLIGSLWERGQYFIIKFNFLGFLSCVQNFKVAGIRLGTQAKII